MIALLMRIRPLLPERIWRSLRDSFWRRYWAGQTAEQRRSIAADAADLAGSERATLIEAIADRYPFSCVLDIGSGFGQNETVLAPFFPGAAFTGIDPDPVSLEHSGRIVAAEGINNVKFIRAFAEDLSRFPDRSFDLVYSCAALLYLGPEQIIPAAREMVRVAKRSILLMEQHDGTGDPGGEQIERGYASSGYSAPTGYWIRDYKAAFCRAAPDARISVSAIANPVWPAEQWKRYASLISVEL